MLDCIVGVSDSATEMLLRLVGKNFLDGLVSSCLLIFIYVVLDFVLVESYCRR